MTLKFCIEYISTSTWSLFCLYSIFPKKFILATEISRTKHTATASSVVAQCADQAQAAVVIFCGGRCRQMTILHERSNFLSETRKLDARTTEKATNAFLVVDNSTKRDWSKTSSLLLATQCSIVVNLGFLNLAFVPIIKKPDIFIIQ